MAIRDLPTLADDPRRVRQKFEEPTRHDTAKARKAAQDLAWRTVCAVVDRRDGKQCRCCDRRSDPEATGLLVRGHRHHIVYRSAGGPDTPENVITLCASCHADEHANKLRIEGNPEVAVQFFRMDAQGGWYCCREEVAVRQVRRD
jgi:hypothetical protein